MERLTIDKIRFFRVERTYAVRTGKWYFEFEAVTGGDMRVGWARPDCKPDLELGTDELAFVFDGYRVRATRPPPLPRSLVIVTIAILGFDASGCGAAQFMTAHR